MPLEDIKAMISQSDEVMAGKRFDFGQNWQQFLAHLDEERIVSAERSLVRMLQVNSLVGKTFMDIGCGSGLFSLAAHRLGAKVVSIDYDPKCVACAEYLKSKYASSNDHWTIHQASVLDSDFMAKLPEADIVYSWGVLHHTGEMWAAVDQASRKVRVGGLLYIALYNDQGGASRRWLLVKRLFNRMPRIGKPLFVGVIALAFELKYALIRLLRGRNPLPFHEWRKKVSDSRGMSVWHDWVDWVGGLPFEVAKPEDVLRRIRKQGFSLEDLQTVGGDLGCNEFLFQRRG